MRGESFLKLQMIPFMRNESPASSRIRPTGNRTPRNGVALTWVRYLLIVSVGSDGIDDTIWLRRATEGVTLAYSQR